MIKSKEETIKLLSNRITELREQLLSCQDLVLRDIRDELDYIKRSTANMTNTTYKEDIPAYALSYLVNGDDSGLEEEDIEAIDNFMEQFHREADEIKGYIVIDVISKDPFFTHNPAFGLACDCYECNICIIKC